MKILFDHQIFSLQQYGGISKYFVKLMKGLREHQDAVTDLSCSLSSNEDLLGSQLFPVKPFFRGQMFKGKTRLLYELNQAFSRQKIRRSEFSVFHPTYYDMYFSPLLAKKPFVITCHDLTHEKLQDQFPYLKKEFPFGKGKARILSACDRIIAVSENTKKDIIEHYNIEPSKIQVIYLAHDKRYDQVPSVSSALLPEKYFLYVGSRTGYKNFS